MAGEFKTLRGGSVRLFMRKDTPKIWATVKAPDGKWLKRSMKTTDEAEASTKAEDWYGELQLRQKYGLSATPQKFKAVAERYLEEMRDEIATGNRPERQLVDYGGVIRLYLMPYFHEELDRDIDAITRRDILNFWEWRRTFWTAGPGKGQRITYVRNGKTLSRDPLRKAPSKSRLGTERTALRQVFNTAVKLGHIQESQIPNLNPDTSGKKGDKTNPLPIFNIEEIRKLYPAMDEWVSQAWGKKRWRRALMRDYVDFVLNTGVRPGTETNNLEWKDIRAIHTSNDRQWRFKMLMEKDFKGSLRANITVDGKNGVRECVGGRRAITALGNIYSRHGKQPLNHPNKPKEKKAGWKKDREPNLDLPIFSLPDGERVVESQMAGLFKNFLKDAGMRNNARGEARTLYALRRTYATEQLLSGKTEVYYLAKQMGTSVAMI